MIDNAEKYKGTTERMIEIDAIICGNCGWPNGNTTNWALPRQATDGDATIPVPQGSHGLTKAQMISGIDDEIVTGVEYPDPVEQ